MPVALGRTLVPGDNRLATTQSAVLDYGFWERQFGADRRVLGRTISIAGRPVEIVGVLAPPARLLEDTDVYAPLAYTPDIQRGQRERAPK